MDLRFLDEIKYNSSKTYIGYAQTTGLYFVIFFGVISLIVNIIFIINFIMTLKQNKKNKSSSLEKLMLILSIIECLISLCWIFTAKNFPTNYDIIDDVIGKNLKERIINSRCCNLGFFTTFLYNFDWLLLSFVILHIKDIILNPVESVLKSDKTIKKYFLSCLIFGLFIGIICYLLDIYGRSPMITCNIQLTYLSDRYGQGTFKEKAIVSFMIVPLIPLFLGIYGVINILRSDEYKNDNDIKTFFKNYLIYIGTYIISSFIYCLLYIIDYLIKVKYDENLKWVFTIGTMFICSTPSIIGIIRLIQTKSYKRIKIKCFKETTIDRNSLNSTTLLEFRNFENSSVNNFISNIYISICSIFSLTKKINKVGNLFDINHKNSIATSTYIITNSNITDERLVDDLDLINKDKFEISCVEFAPKIFSYLRNEDNLNEDTFINSFLPSKNIKEAIKESEAKGGNFFLNSYDKRFILKTLNYQEVELIRNLLLEKLAGHFSRNKDSLLVRFYGMFKIITKSGVFKQNEIFFIIMKNVYGIFENNYLLKFDMKGSELNREVFFAKNADVKKLVLKDTNFLNMEHVLLLNNDNLIKLREITRNDSTFLLNNGIMDYSLFVIKLKMNNDEMKLLFENKEKLIDNHYNLDSYTLNVKSSIEKNDYNYQNINFPFNFITPLKKYLFPSLDSKYFYIICIIDYFQLYSFQKFLETQIKKMKVTKNKISSVPPNEYKERFDFFIQKITSPEQIEKELRNLNLIKS